MCDRTTAIKYLITNKFGSKDELRERIGEHYPIFVATGFIYELPEAPKLAPPVSQSRPTQSPIVIREWVATREAFKRAKILRIREDRKLLLKSRTELHNSIKGAKLKKKSKRNFGLFNILFRSGELCEDDSDNK